MFPPWHGAGHGQELYGIMYKHLTSSPNVREFTVEDPNEKFDDLRDLCDLLYLRANVPEFASLRVNTDIPAEKLALDENVPVNLIVPEAVRKHIMRDTKIMPRQFDRLVEMHTLSFIPHQHRSRNRLSKKHRATDPNDRAYYFWRLYVKQRLYMFNRDQLGQVEHQERVDKLNGALDSVLEQYTQTLERLEKIEQEKPVTAAAGKRKRRVVDDDEDDEDVDDVGKENEVAARDQEGQKKLKVG
jgi:histone acetyltransferase 1